MSLTHREFWIILILILEKKKTTPNGYKFSAFNITE